MPLIRQKHALRTWSMTLISSWSALLPCTGRISRIAVATSTRPGTLWSAVCLPFTMPSAATVHRDTNHSWRAPAASHRRRTATRCASRAPRVRCVPMFFSAHSCCRADSPWTSSSMSLALTAHPGGSCNPVSDTGTATRDSESRFFAERALRPVATIVSDGHCSLPAGVHV